MILYTKVDDFINVHQSREIYAAYAGSRKYLYTPTGSHGTPRKNYSISMELNFAFDCLELDITLDDISDIDDNSSSHFVNAIALAAHSRNAEIV